MRQFIKRTYFFILPIIFLHILTYSYYEPEKGDLLRIGYIFNSYPEYRGVFSLEYANKLKVVPITQIKEGGEYDLLTIGDSFSDQWEVGYQNYLALNYGLEIVHISRRFHSNQIQTLIGLLNTDFFEKNKFKYVLIEFVEAGSRHVYENLDFNFVYPLIKFNDPYEIDFSDYTKRYIFPSDRIVKFPYYNLKRLFFPSLDFNEVYCGQLNKNYFSINSRDLYFHSSNPLFSNNNNETDINNLNQSLNKINSLLKGKGIELIIMPVPDKLDFYYDEVKKMRKFEESNFFEIMKTMNKEYLYVDSFEVLKRFRENKKDIYYFDDTHWSPVGAKIISEFIYKDISL